MTDSAQPEGRRPIFHDGCSTCGMEPGWWVPAAQPPAKSQALRAGRDAGDTSVDVTRPGTDERCEPVYGSCRLLSGHPGNHNAWAGIPSIEALEDALRYASAATDKPLDETTFRDLAASMRRRMATR